MQLKNFVYFFLCLSVTTQAQNLVSNGNFEVYSTCPTGISQINYATGWINAQSSTTPDYFNSCNTANVSVPNTVFGYQQDYNTGNGFAGIYTFNKGFPNQAREYIQTKLNDTLKTNKKYLVSMYVNACDVYNYVLTTLDMYFTNTAIQGPTTYAFMNIPNPQLKNATLLNDTINWLLVQDTVIGAGERYLTIGNFTYDSLSDTVRVYNMGFGTSNDNAYYYIDGVSVYDITSRACNNYWDAGFDKYILAGNSIRLGAINTDSSVYTWVNSAGGNTHLNSNTDARPWSTPTVTTKYYVTKTCPNNNTFLDTVTVYVQQPLAVNEIKNKSVEINIFPNPNNGTFTLHYDLKENAAIEMTDISGKLVGKYNLAASENTMEIKNDNLQNGIYLYRIVSNKGAAIKTGKIAIMK